MAALLAGALLLAFVQVLLAAGRESDLRRRAVAAHTEAIWRCRAERNRLLRDDCLARLAPARAAVHPT